MRKSRLVFFMQYFPKKLEKEESRARQESPSLATSPKAALSLFLGLISFCIPVLPAILAVHLGQQAFGEIRLNPDRLKGRALAICGIIAGSIGVVLIPILHMSLWFSWQRNIAHRERPGLTQSMNNMHQIGLAMHNYVHDHKVFPPAVVYSQDGKPLYSWRVLLLPYIEESSLYRQFKLDESWDSPNNKHLLSRMPGVYRNPLESKRKEAYGTHYLVFTGGGAMFEANSGARPLSIKEIVAADGTCKTIMVVEAAEAVPWTKPQDLPYSPDQPLPQMTGLRSMEFLGMFADGSVRVLPNNIDEPTFRAMITWNGGEIFRFPEPPQP